MFIAALFIIAKIWQEHMFIDRCMDKESIEYLFNGTLFSSKKEKKTSICDNMDVPWGVTLAKI